MSDKELEVANTVVEEVPQEIIDLRQTLEKFNNLRNLVQVGTYPGRSAKDVVSLQELLKDMYDQTWIKFSTHPFYIANMGVQADD